MLSLDIETTGLSPNSSHDTLACTCEYDVNMQLLTNTYHMWKPVEKGCTCSPKAINNADANARTFRCRPCQAWHAENAKRLFDALDNAVSICGYNCIRFDIPYLQAMYTLDTKRVDGWIAKSLDPFFFISDKMGIYCKLDTLLRFNGMESKSGSGKEAVVMAYNRKWDELEQYCARDAKLTMDLVQLQNIKVPINTISGVVPAEIQLTREHPMVLPSWTVCIPINKRTLPTTTTTAKSFTKRAKKSVI